MSSGFVVLIFIILVLAVLLVLILAWPIRLQLHWESQGRRVRWNWLGFTLETYDGVRTLWWGSWRLRSRTIQSKTPENAKEPRRSGAGNWWRHLDLVKETIEAFWQGIQLFLKRLQFERFHMQVQIGTPDPALTGTLYAYATAAHYVGHHWFPQMELELQPDFQTEKTTIRGEVSLSIRPIDILWVGARVFRKLPKRKLWQVIRESKRKHNTQGGVARERTSGVTQDVGR